MTEEERKIYLDGLLMHFELHRKKQMEFRALIIQNGGVDPDGYENVNTYPAYKTIKDKIKFILKENQNQKLTSKEIANSMKIYEPDVNPISVNQICVKLGKSNEIGVESGYKNKYYHIKMSK